MCGVCGCDAVDELDHDHDHSGHTHDHDHSGHTHDHDHSAHDHGDGDGNGDGRVAWVVRAEREILAKNDRIAATNRKLLAATSTLALNLVSSPGAGKTSLLVRSLEELRGRWPLVVIEGDQATTLDAERVRATGARALQINTGKMCHLDAGMIAEALGALPVPARGILFIENVGNLVCPAGFDLGENAKVVLASVTEGEDKPLKYPDMFRAARLLVVTKVDLLPHLDFDAAALVSNARRANPEIEVLRVSTRTGEGLDAWYAWLERALGSVERAS